MNNPLRLTVLGLWHLGSVTAACCARHFRVVGLDFNASNIAALNEGKAPLFEPGLNELIAGGLASGKLSFTVDAKTACAETDVLWLCSDTPVNEDDESDVESVLADLRRAAPHMPGGALVLVSAQLPVGTCAMLEREFSQLRFACSPENLRLGKAIESFEKADRVVVGVHDDGVKPLAKELFAPFSSQILFMRTESAEMVKHALNSFLALSITFINEIARICEHTGADAKEVSAGLKSESRIGPRAYLGPGGPFAGGTLARDVVTLARLAHEKNETLALIPAIKQSNDQHRGWMFRRLQTRLGDLKGKKIAVLGLTYKPGTDTLRRSVALELCGQLLAAGAAVRAFDPVVKSLPSDFAAMTVATDPGEALKDADAAVVCTEWPEFRRINWSEPASTMRQRIVIDANRFLEKELKDVPGVEHLSVGRAL
jgi:UDPglucose 6-dehydrogenase